MGIRSLNGRTDDINTVSAQFGLGIIIIIIIIIIGISTIKGTEPACIL